MKQEISSNELLEVQIKNNNKILVNESLELNTHRADTVANGNFASESTEGLHAEINFNRVEFLGTVNHLGAQYKAEKLTVLIVVSRKAANNYGYRITAFTPVKVAA